MGPYGPLCLTVYEATRPMGLYASWDNMALTAIMVHEVKSFMSLCGLLHFMMVNYVSWLVGQHSPRGNVVHGVL